jgi:hypothetical protein
MPKQLLTGTLEEQCEFLYSLAREKMAQGNFTGAVYALQEIAKHAPNYKDVQALLSEAKEQKALQRRLLLGGLLGAMIFVGIGTYSSIRNDFLLIGLALLGLIVGYGVANYLNSFRRRHMPGTRI